MRLVGKINYKLTAKTPYYCGYPASKHTSLPQKHPQIAVTLPPNIQAYRKNTLKLRLPCTQTDKLTAKTPPNCGYLAAKLTSLPHIKLPAPTAGRVIPNKITTFVLYTIPAMKRVMLVFGTRPEAIKMCPLVRELRRYPEEFQTTVCVTGQHREMLDQVLGIFGVTPDYDLNIMKQGQDLYDITTAVLTGMRGILNEAQPDIVLVHGDTTTSAAAALAAFYRQIPVGHVEAGLRTRNIYSPWPEELNRQITSRIATYNFAPTPLAESNLEEEKAPGRIFVTGNTVIDALRMVVDRLKADPALAAEQISTIQKAGYDPTRLTTGGNPSNGTPNPTGAPQATGPQKRLILITGHRRENFGSGFISMLTAMKDLSSKYPDVDFVYPMHLNPNVRSYIKDVFGATPGRPNFFFIEPLQYLEFVFLMEKSTLILTDSGGIQEEAPGLGKPVLVMREITERPEALKAGTVKLVGTDHDLILNEVSSLLDDPAAYARMSKAVNPYGDGRACSRIVSALRGQTPERYD